MRYLLLLPTLLLTQCVDPYGNPIAPFGPAMPPPYTDQREQYRSDLRDYEREQNLRAHERGINDGRADYGAGLPKDSARHFQSYTPATRHTYQDGYDKGYGVTGPIQGTQDTNYPRPDPAYSQGYDCGMRDRVGGRQHDPGAYVGSYDPRFRRSFENGYGDAYYSRRRF